MEQVEVTLKLTFEVESADKDYYINADGTPTVGLLADIFDLVGTDLPIEAINDLTQDDIRKKLSEAAGV